MSLQAKILDLISGFNDPTLRVDVSATINYLFQLYASGSAAEDRIRDSVYEVCYDVIRAKAPDLTDEEVRERARQMTEEFMRAFRLESALRRTMARVRPLPRV